MKFTQLENGYFQSEDGCLTVPNAPGNRHFDRIQAYLDEGNELDENKSVDIPNEWVKIIPEPEPEPEIKEEL